MTNPVLDDIPPQVAALAPYQPGRPVADVMRERGVADVVKLASNENPLGCGARARAALAAPDGEMLSRYPDSAALSLRAALARNLRVRTENILAGNGSNDILELAAQLLLAPGRAAVYSRHAFIVYKLAVAARRARAVVVPAKNHAHDLDAIARAAQDDEVRIVFVANPNNPTGTFHESESIRKMMGRIPARALVVLDEAYFEYAGEPPPGESIRMLREFPNLLVARTFSKIHGLAGLRVGYGVGSAEVMDALNRIRQPFNLNAAAQRAALAALEDDDFVSQSQALNANGMAQMEKGLDALGLERLPSRGNFIAFKVADAEACFENLLDAGIIVRKLAEYEMPNWLRATIGSEGENIRLLDALRKSKAAGPTEPSGPSGPSER